MSPRYSTLQDLEGRLSIDASEYTDDLADKEKEPSHKAKILIVSFLKWFTAFSLLLSYTLLVLFLGHAWKRLDGSNSHPTPPSLYLLDQHFKLLPQVYDQSITFNGTLDYSSKFRGVPSPDIDRAWNRSINLGAVNITFSNDDMRLLGMDPDSSVKLPPEDGGIYRLHFKFSHQMHCVNYLRMWTYRDYFKERQAEFSDSLATQRIHIDHCIEMLRQFVMCHADTNLVSANWVAGSNLPAPNFNSKHTCRDFDAIVDWAWENQIPIRSASKSAGVNELPFQP